MRSLIDMAADRGAFIDQSQSLNLFIEARTSDSSRACTSRVEERAQDDYYATRSRPATRIAKATVETAPAVDEAAVACRRGETCRPASERAPPARAPARPGLCLTAPADGVPEVLRDVPRRAIKNTWTVEEVDFSTDVGDLQTKMTDAERHLVHRLVAFFATGDSIVANNLVLNLYRHINAPEARGCYLSRQLYEEALHVQFYLTLLDTYVPDPRERHRAFAAVGNIPIDPEEGRTSACSGLDSTRRPARASRRAPSDEQFLLNLHLLRRPASRGSSSSGPSPTSTSCARRGLLHGLAAGTSWVFRDESAHMAFAFEVVQAPSAARSQSSSTPSMTLPLAPDDRRGGRLRDASSPRTSLGGRSRRAVGRRRAPLPRILRRPARCRPPRVWRQRTARNPLRLHGPAGRAGGHQLLRAPGLGLPGGRHRRTWCSTRHFEKIAERKRTFRGTMGHRGSRLHRADEIDDVGRKPPRVDGGDGDNLGRGAHPASAGTFWRLDGATPVGGGDAFLRHTTSPGPGEVEDLVRRGVSPVLSPGAKLRDPLRGFLIGSPAGERAAKAWRLATALLPNSGMTRQSPVPVRDGDWRATRIVRRRPPGIGWAARAIRCIAQHVNSCRWPVLAALWPVRSRACGASGGGDGRSRSGALASGRGLGPTQRAVLLTTAAKMETTARWIVWPLSDLARAWAEPARRAPGAPARGRLDAGLVGGACGRLGGRWPARSRSRSGTVGGQALAPARPSTLIEETDARWRLHSRWVARWPGSGSPAGSRVGLEHGSLSWVVSTGADRFGTAPRGRPRPRWFTARTHWSVEGGALRRGRGTVRHRAVSANDLLRVHLRSGVSDRRGPPDPRRRDLLPGQVEAVTGSCASATAPAETAAPSATAERRSRSGWSRRRSLRSWRRLPSRQASSACCSACRAGGACRAGRA